MRKSNLKGHIKTQHKGLCFSCDQCDSKTPYPANLKIHIELKHKGIRHRCDQCNFKALRKEQLKLHIAIKHDGIWYNCNECGYTASFKGNLWTHIKTQHVRSLDLSMIYVVSASINQLPNKAIRSIRKLNMKVFITNVKNVIIRQKGNSL